MRLATCGHVYTCSCLQSLDLLSMVAGSANLKWPEEGSYGGGEVYIGPSNEEVAQSRCDKYSIHQSIP